MHRHPTPRAARPHRTRKRSQIHRATASDRSTQPTLTNQVRDNGVTLRVDVGFDAPSSGPHGPDRPRRSRTHRLTVRHSTGMPFGIVRDGRSRRRSGAGVRCLDDGRPVGIERAPIAESGRGTLAATSGRPGEASSARSVGGRGARVSRTAIVPIQANSGVSGRCVYRGPFEHVDAPRAVPAAPDTSATRRSVAPASLGPCRQVI